MSEWNQCPRCGEKVENQTECQTCANPQVRIPAGESTVELEYAEAERMGAKELARRYVNQRTHLKAFFECLDGIKEIQNIPGGGSDGTRNGQDIRRVVEMLVKKCDVTWEDSFDGRRKTESIPPEQFFERLKNTLDKK